MGDEIARWAGAAKNLAQSLNTYAELVGAKPAGEVQTPSPPASDSEGAELAKLALAVFGGVRDTGAALDRLAEAALDPQKARAATFRSSRTAVEGVERAGKKLGAARARLRAAAREVLRALAEKWGAPIARGAPAEVVPVLKAAPVVGSDLIVATLQAWRETGEDVRALVSEFADLSLGIGPQPPTEARIAARRLLHPIQAMGITFGLAPKRGGEIEPAAGVFIDATLPQAATAVTYNLDPLIEPAAAAKFGPIGTTVSGLGFKLVERFRTIREDPVSPSEPTQRDTPGLFTKGQITIRVAPVTVVRTIDGGLTHQPLAGPLPSGAYGTVGAGPIARVTKMGELLGEAVESSPGPAFLQMADRDAFVQRFRDWSLSTSTPGSSDIDRGPVISALARGFARAYDQAKPPTIHAYREVVLGEGDTRDPNRTYIAKALAEVGARRSEMRAMKNDVLSGSVATFGGRTAASREVAKEFLISDVVQLWGGIAAVRSKLSAAYATLDAEIIAERVYEAKGAARRRDALALYARIVEKALRIPLRTVGSARVVEKVESVDPRPSLKAFLLDRGDISAS